MEWKLESHEYNNINRALKVRTIARKIGNVPLFIGQHNYCISVFIFYFNIHLAH